MTVLTDPSGAVFDTPEVVPDLTFNMLADPRAKAIWSVIKDWDITIPGKHFREGLKKSDYVKMILSALQKVPDNPKTTSTVQEDPTNEILISLDRLTSLVERLAYTSSIEPDVNQVSVHVAKLCDKYGVYKKGSEAS